MKQRYDLEYFLDKAIRILDNKYYFNYNNTY